MLGDMADEEDFEGDQPDFEGATSGGGGKKKLLLLVVLPLVLVLGGGAAAYFTGLADPVVAIITGQKKDVAADEPKEEGKGEKDKKGGKEAAKAPPSGDPATNAVFYDL